MWCPSCGSHNCVHMQMGMQNTQQHLQHQQLDYMRMLRDQAASEISRQIDNAILSNKNTKKKLLLIRK